MGFRVAFSATPWGHQGSAPFPSLCSAILVVSFVLPTQAGSLHGHEMTCFFLYVQGEGTSFASFLLREGKKQNSP